MPVLDRYLWGATIVQEYLGACIPANHPFKNKLPLSAHDLIEETIYWMPQSSHPAFYEQVTDYLYGVGIHLHSL